MAGKTCRTVVCTLAVALLLPLAGASAAPVRTREATAPGIQLPGWSRIVRSFDGWLERFLPAFERNGVIPPPAYQGWNDPAGHEGSGLDPHGKPKP